MAFTSEATNLSPLDSDAYPDTYVHEFYVSPLPGTLALDPDDLDVRRESITKQDLTFQLKRQIGST